MKTFTDKYRPRTPKDIIGQDIAIQKLRNFIANYPKEKKRAALLYGSSGVGKTSSVYTIANETGLEIVEVNASDFRNADQINQKVGNAVRQRSLFSKGKIILVDEVEGIAGMSDRGGLQAIIKIIEETRYPIVLTAMDPFDNKFSSLRSKSSMIEFVLLDSTSIFEILKKICANEKIKYEDEVLKSLSRRAGGDARAAINDLQTLSNEKKELTKESLGEVSDRQKVESITAALNKIFKTTDLKIASSAFENVDEDLDEQLLWIDENLPKEYTKPEDLAAAYDKLSKADVFSRRIRRWQYYRFLVYINSLITAGIASSKNAKYSNPVEYKPTGRILKIWWANQKSMKKKAIAEKIAHKTHSSKKDIIKSTMPYLPLMFRDREMKNNLIKEFDLDDEQVEWVEKQNK